MMEESSMDKSSATMYVLSIFRVPLTNEMRISDDSCSGKNTLKLEVM